MQKTDSKQRGFTLIETIIYVGLFGVLFAGILTTVFPLVSGSDRLSRKIAVEGEVAFILHKIDYALAQGIVENDDIDTMLPSQGNPAIDSLTIKDQISGNPNRFQFLFDSVNKQITYREASWSAALPLNAERVEITGFSVEHVGANTEPNYIEVTMDVRRKGETISETVGPVRYHLHF